LETFSTESTYTASLIIVLNLFPNAGQSEGLYPAAALVVDVAGIEPEYLVKH
jgi:hypothetical protein